MEKIIVFLCLQMNKININYSLIYFVISAFYKFKIHASLFLFYVTLLSMDFVYAASKSRWDDQFKL